MRPTNFWVPLRFNLKTAHNSVTVLTIAALVLAACGGPEVVTPSVAAPAATDTVLDEPTSVPAIEDAAEVSDAEVEVLDEPTSVPATEEAVEVKEEEEPEPEVVVESALWLLAQDVDSFTAQLVSRVDFGETWGPAKSS